MPAPKLADVIPLQTVHNMEQGRRLLDQWIAHANKMEYLYELAAIQRDMSQLLLADALAELERLRELVI